MLIRVLLCRYFGYINSRTLPLQTRPAQYQTMNTKPVIETVPVDSTMLQAVAYDAETQCLTLTFHTGAVYEYEGVPKRVYDELLIADSKGQYAHAHIVDCYPYRQVRRR